MSISKSIKSYEEFVNEGIVSSIKYQYRITKVNAFVFAKSAELIEKDPKRYKTAADTLDHIKNDVRKKYEEAMKDLDDVITFEQWWKEFTEKFKQMQTLEQK